VSDLRDVSDARDVAAGSPLWLRFVGPITALALLSRVDVREIVASLAEVRWPPLALSLVLAAPLLVAKAWRWRLLLRAYGQRISLLEASRLYTISAGAARSPRAPSEIFGRVCRPRSAAAELEWIAARRAVRFAVATATLASESLSRGLCCFSIPGVTRL
jgi:uncharacterized membrane protein YbhN (UPF0104 family)